MDAHIKRRLVSAEEAQELIAAIRARLAKSSPGPCRLSMYDPDRDPVELFRENLSHGSGNVWAVGLPEHPFSVGGWEDRPEHLVITCVTGNGPTSEANAVFYASARADIEALLSRLEDVERERDSERANGNDLADAVVRLEAERDRLREVLACERGERAPEGWTWAQRRSTDMVGRTLSTYHAWLYGPEDTGFEVVREANGGWSVALTRDRISPFPTALEAIEAADRAAKETK